MLRDRVLHFTLSSHCKGYTNYRPTNQHKLSLQTTLSLVKESLVKIPSQRWISLSEYNSLICIFLYSKTKINKTNNQKK